MMETHNPRPHAESGDVVAAALAPAPPAEHLVSLSAGQWAAWRCVALRGAGFPAELAGILGEPECAAAADELLRSEDAVEQARVEALSVLEREYGLAGANEHIHLIEAMRRLRKGKEVKGGESLPAPARLALSRLSSARSSLRDARSSFSSSFDSALASNSAALRRLASDARLREAVTWQNRGAARTGLRPLAEGGASGSKRRQQEALAASYLQRYSLKNDTIGFFGPVAWAKFVDHGEAVSVKPGEGLLSAREVRFESWCVDALASRLSGDGRLRPWLAPRRVPYVALEGVWLRVGGGGRVRLGEAQAEAMRLSDGVRRGVEVARELEARGLVGSETEGLGVLEGLLGRGLINWSLDVPLCLNPERALREALEGVGDVGLRSNALAALDELESARARIAHAAGDAEALDRAIGGLEETFTRLTGVAPTRAAGKTYAARTLVYEDCRRDVEVELGPGLVEALSAPLSLLLTSARWFTYEAARIYRAAFRQVYTGLARVAGSRVVDATSFWRQVQPLLFSKGPRPIDALIPAFHRKWAEVLRIEPGSRKAEYSSEQLRAAVEREFAAPGPGWRSACYHSPDVMIEAEGSEALRQGRYRIVLGELHLALNTLNASLRVSQHPRPEELIEALDRDLPEPRLVPVNPKDWPGATARTLPALVSHKDFRLIVSPEPHGISPSRALPIGELVLEEEPGGLFLRSLDGSFRSEIIEAFGTALSSVVGNFFHILEPKEHTPRVTIDGVVVCRESWRIDSRSLRQYAPFAFERDEPSRFLAARRFARSSGMPRHAFAKVPVEVKPFYVDFASPVYVEMLARMIRRTEEGGGGGRVTVSEMLPGASGAWLEDGEGRRYTSELRIVAVDLLK